MELSFQWAVARMVTFTFIFYRMYTSRRVSVGCCPDGHFHKLSQDIYGTPYCFSGLLPGWSLSQLSHIPVDLPKEFQWAVARMVTFTRVKQGERNPYEFQWAVARMVTFTLPDMRSEAVLLFQWAVARMVTFTQTQQQVNDDQMFQWAVARMVTFTRSSYRW